MGEVLDRSSVVSLYDLPREVACLLVNYAWMDFVFLLSCTPTIELSCKHGTTRQRRFFNTMNIGLKEKPQLRLIWV